MFEMVDFVFIDGNERYLPWRSCAKKLTLFIKLCKLKNKYLYVSGFAFSTMVYLLATDYLTDANIINANGELKSIEELGSYSYNDIKQMRKNDFFLDYVTGDLLIYNTLNLQWVPKINIGLHNTQMAQKYSIYVSNL